MSKIFIIFLGLICSSIAFPSGLISLQEADSLALVKSSEPVVPTDSVGNGTSPTPPVDNSTTPIDPNSNSTTPTDPANNNTGPTDNTTNPTDNTTNPTDNTTNPTDNNTNPVPPVAIVCPRYNCSKERHTPCVIQGNNTWTITKCNKGYECSFSFQNISNASCILDVDSSDNEICHAGYIPANGNCTQANYCTSGHFCDTNTSTCKPRSLNGANCSQLYECKEYSVCNLGKCIQQFSLPAGNSSESSIACASGIVLNSTCQPAELTSGAMPKECLFDSNCTAANGVTPGTCKCGFNKNGTAYCLPHRSDKVNLDLIEATYNGNYEEIAYFTFRLSHYDWITGELRKETHDDCLDDSIELEQYEDLEDYFAMCSPKCTKKGSCREYVID